MSTEQEVNINLHVSTPKKDSEVDLMGLLSMFYQAAYQNAIGVAHVLNVETGKQEIVLAGLEQHPDGLRYVPIALVLDAASSALYVPLEASKEVTEEEVEE